MKDDDSRGANFFRDFAVMSPRERWHAGRDLDHASRHTELGLADLLRRASSTSMIVELLELLAKGKMADSRTRDLIVRQLEARDPSIRSAAAAALLHASPKLKSVLPKLRALAANDRDTRVRRALGKVLERYSKRSGDVSRRQGR